VRKPTIRLSAVCSRSETESVVIFPTATPPRPGITNPTSVMPENVQAHPCWECVTFSISSCNFTSICCW